MDEEQIDSERITREELAQLWQVGASQGWDFALAAPAEFRAREQQTCETMLARIGEAWWKGPEAWERLRAREACLAVYPHPAAAFAMAWLAGFARGLTVTNPLHTAPIVRPS